jgi:hypothetical protein
MWNCLTLALKYERNSETLACVSLFGANAVVLEAADGPNLIEQFRIVPPHRTGKMPAMTDLDGATIKLKRIRPKKCVFKGSIIGPNPR